MLRALNLVSVMNTMRRGLELEVLPSLTPLSEEGRSLCRRARRCGLSQLAACARMQARTSGAMCRTSALTLRRRHSGPPLPTTSTASTCSSRTSRSPARRCLWRCLCTVARGNEVTGRAG